MGEDALNAIVPHGRGVALNTRVGIPYSCYQCWKVCSFHEAEECYNCTGKAPNTNAEFEKIVSAIRKAKDVNDEHRQLDVNGLKELHRQGCKTLVERTVQEDDDRFCDVCKAKFLEGNKAMWCEKCNWDMCMDCSVSEGRQ